MSLIIASCGLEVQAQKTEKTPVLERRMMECFIRRTEMLLDKNNENYEMNAPNMLPPGNNLICCHHLTVW
jgi:hypothetical protein